MSKHTAGPWSVCGNEIFSVANDAKVATVWSGEDSQGMLNKAISASQADRNAARIVACVNACEGISTEALEACHGKPPARFAGIEALRAENERLRNALRFVLADLNTELDYECRLIVEAALAN